MTISADRQSATVGDPVNFTLTVRYDSSLKFSAPPRRHDLGQFEVLGDTTLPDAGGKDGLHRYQRRWRVAGFQTGDLWIPALSGILIGPTGDTLTWQSDSIAITIASVLTGGDTTDIHGLKGPYVAGESAWIVWLIGAVVLAAALGLWWWRRSRRRRASAPAAPSIPAWEAALHALQTMRSELDPGADGGRVWYFRLSEILRRYWDGRYGWQSIDQTTHEIIEKLPLAPFEGSHRGRAREFLEIADQVRYARLAARSGRPEVDWDWVRAFVADTTPRVISTDGGNAAGSTRPEAGDQRVSTEPTPERGVQ